jgi:hypothetical protein
MKRILRFFYILVALITASLFFMSSLNREKIEKYQKDYVYYESPAPTGTILATENLFKNITESKVTIKALDLTGSKTYLSNFENIQLLSGKVPNNENQYISDEKDQKSVGRYKSTLETQGLSKIYGFPSTKEVRVLEFEFNRNLSNSEKNYLTTQGFIKIDNENLAQEINSSQYSFLIGLIQVLTVFLSIILLVFWITFLLNYIDQNQRKIELLKSFGARKFEVVKIFLRINKRVFLRTSLELLMLLILVVSIIYLLFKQIFILSAFTIFSVSIITMILSFSLCFYLKLREVKSGKTIKISFILFSILIFILLAYQVRFWVLPFVAVILIASWQYKKTLKLKTIFKPSVMSIFVTLSIILSILSIIFLLVSATYQSEKKQEENFIQTTVPKNLFFYGQYEILDIPKTAKIETHHRIRPLSGVTVNDTLLYPEIFSTNMDYYQQFNLEGGSYTTDSVLVGDSFAKRAKINIGDRIIVNGKTLKITNIINSSYNGGNVIYMSDSKYSKVYGNMGIYYYLTDYSKTELSNVIGAKAYKGMKVFSKTDAKKVYSTTIAGIFAMISGVSLFVLIIALALSYQIINLTLTELRRELNILRAFGMSRKQYFGLFIRYFALVILGSICLASYLIVIFNEQIKTIILNQMGNLLEINITFSNLILLFLILSFALLLSLILNYRKMKKQSIYQQYLESFVE